jgi:hypothetical protein
MVFPIPCFLTEQGMGDNNRSGMPNSTQKVGHHFDGDLQAFEDSKFIYKKGERRLEKK